LDGSLEEGDILTVSVDKEKEETIINVIKKELIEQ